MIAKYKVGDWVTIKFPPSSQPKLDKLIVPKLHILEVRTQLCEAGVQQVTYIGRLWTGHCVDARCTRQMEMREIELDELTEPAKETP